MRKIICRMHAEIDVDLVTFNKDSHFALFEITFGGFKKTKVVLSGETLSKILKTSDELISERIKADG